MKLTIFFLQSVIYSSNGYTLFFWLKNVRFECHKRTKITVNKIWFFWDIILTRLCTFPIYFSRHFGFCWRFRIVWDKQMIIRILTLISDEHFCKMCFCRERKKATENRLKSYFSILLETTRDGAIQTIDRIHI